ncbi:uncharacterized protein SPSK_09383 [Sporothrix schenckii 1099-18]|uniref:Integral membrane protein n=1 Tax=Sporothrix schenckii 1099-18 TaxID=1397361 RepID=A0A0F2M7V8_SPOSC|nr:uncharacterized protein SPSK_09383 [Sporothrix schenckii 1099-18]KJR85159.1 integral membrane protein [Sporothrix schenckii 1099-18]
MLQVKYGLGQHIGDVPEEHLEKFFQCLWATIPVYNLSLIFSKLSIIFQYKHVFAVAIVQRICFFFLIFLGIYGCWAFFGSVFMCVPVQYFWGVGEGHCLNKLAFWFSNASINIATDIAIILLPMPLIKGLQIPTRQKVILMVIFAFGTVVCITSIIRLRSLLSISVSPDTTFAGVDIAMWSNIEINVAIICASAPALKPFVSRIAPKLLGSSGNSGNRSRGTGYGPNSQRGDAFGMNSFNRKATASGTGRNPSGSNDRDIYVQHTFEILDDGDGKTSREGSERNLVRGKDV